MKPFISWLMTWSLSPLCSDVFTAIKFSKLSGKCCNHIHISISILNDITEICFHHAFRFHSVHWRTWAACFIQASWRRHCKQKLAKSLREAEDKLQDALATEAGTSTSLGATIYASRFAANLLQTLRLPPLPQRPNEPDFTNCWWQMNNMNSYVLRFCYTQTWIWWANGLLPMWLDSPSEPPPPRFNAQGMHVYIYIYSLSHFDYYISSVGALSPFVGVVFRSVLVESNSRRVSTVVVISTKKRKRKKKWIIETQWVYM